MGLVNNQIHALPPSGGSNEPTVGAIKRALHDLTRVASSLPQRDNISLLREAHDLLRQIARRNGVDPDNAVQLGRAAARSQRDRVDLASSSAQD